MSDWSHIPEPNGGATVDVFTGSSNVAGNDWRTWTKPRGKSMIHILLIGKGGNGGLGVVGAVSTAGGGGGGGSGGQSSLMMPLHLLPDTLLISLAGHGTTTTRASYVALGPKLTAGAGAPIVNDTLIYANGGGNGGNASGGSGGGAGAAGGIATVGNMPLGWQYATVLAGQAGIAGGGAGGGAALTLPVTGLLVTGGTGGGGVPASGAGLSGGAFTVAGRFPPHIGGSGGPATTPPMDGTPGYRVLPPLGYWYGGTGGGSTHAIASGAGLYASLGGHGAPGCGGGGNGGALTGTTARSSPDLGLGGPAICIITCW